MVPFIVGLAAVIALVLAVNPTQLASAIRHFRVGFIPAVLLLSVSYYLLQGVRWYFLLRDDGVDISMRDTVLLNVAGQSAALLPLGELTRALLVAEAAHAPLGSVVATVTIQELTYTLILIAAAVPGALEHHAATWPVVGALVATAAVFVILTVAPVFAGVRSVVARTPLLSRMLHDIDRLQRDTVVLLRRPSTWTLSVISVLDALIAITLFWLVVHALAPGVVSWRAAAFVYAVSHVAGAVSLIPGGLGAYEASVAGLLVAAGADLDVAAAAAILHRCADKGINTLTGIGAYVIARRRLHLGRLRGVLKRSAAATAAEQGLASPT